MLFFIILVSFKGHPYGGVDSVLNHKVVSDQVLGSIKNLGEH